MMLAGHKHAVLLSFEGPDRYSSVGGLATRVSGLSKALAAAGVETHLFFIGDPALPAVEAAGERRTLWRWCQWISAYHPRDVYDGEAGKVSDFNGSVPRFVADEIVSKAQVAGERVLVIAEEWQTAEAAIALDRGLRFGGQRESATILWNANNMYGFDRIRWSPLQEAATITTISKYMKFELARWDVPALVIPNGIDDALLDGPPQSVVDGLRAALCGKPALLKVGRFDPDKNWMQAIDAVAELRADGFTPQLIVRGGREPYAEVVFDRARSLRLSIEPIGDGSAAAGGLDADGLAAVLRRCAADVVDLRTFLPDETLYALYAACDAVLANSGKEPFGLVGLEVMAAGGIPVCGSTGEDYAEPFVNALVCDGSDGRELAEYLKALAADERRVDRMRQAGYATATRYVWANVLELLALKLEYVAKRG